MRIPTEWFRWARKGVRAWLSAGDAGRRGLITHRLARLGLRAATGRHPGPPRPPELESSADGLRSDVERFYARYEHAWFKIEWHVPLSMRRGRFLDIGCGIGNGVAAAAAHGASVAVGIDRDLSEFRQEFDPAEFPRLCELLGVPAENIRLLKGNVFESTIEPASFDVAMMLDSAEHVPDPGRFFRWAHRVLIPSGVFLVDTCPLYYSPVGHHLFAEFPEETSAWVHLKPGFEERCRRAGVTDWSLQRFRELNRATHDDLRDAFLAAGFEITYEHRSVASAERRARLDRHRDGIELGPIPERCLYEDWILLVGRK